MSSGDKHRFDRRKFLKATGGLAGAGLVAGCTGDGGDGGDGEDGGTDGGADGGDGGTDGGDGGADEYPTDSVEFVIPFGPGGGYDFYSRLIAKYIPDYIEGLEEVQPTNVEGAGGQVATEDVWNEGDNPGVHWIINMVNFGMTQLTNDVEWDLREFSYFAQVAEEFRGIAVGTNTDIETWDDYVEAAQNEELKFASTGPGSGYVTVPGTTGELSGLYPAENVMENQVVYDGRSEAIQGILAGDAHVMSGSYFSVLDYVESDDLRMIMVCTTDDEPPEQTPDAETFGTVDLDRGEDIVDMLATRRIYAGPPELDDDLVEMCQDAYLTALEEDEDLQAEAEDADRPIVPLNGPDAQEAVQGFIDNWAEREDLLRKLEGMDEDQEISA